MHMSCSMMIQEPPRGSKMDPRRVQNRAKIAQDAPRIPRSAPRPSQERPKTPPERPKSVPERPKSAQERPKSAQERPKTVPSASRRVPRRVSRRSGELSGCVSAPTSSKKECSESDLLRDSLEKLVLSDFLSIFEACAQERTCEKQLKTIGFLRFFVGRRFFE